MINLPLTLSNVSLIDVMPANLTSDPKIYSLCKAIDALNQVVTSAISSVSVLDNLGNQTSDITDLLAFEQRTPFYDQSLSLDVRQGLVQNTGKVNSVKGTKGAIEEIASLVFGDSWVDEWFQYGADPYYFRVNVEASQQGASEDDLAKLQLIIENLKNARSFLDVINIYLTSKCKAYFGAGLTTGEEITVYPWSTRELDSNVPLVIGIGYQAVETVTINPL